MNPEQAHSLTVNILGVLQAQANGLWAIVALVVIIISLLALMALRHRG
jgi:hypothetical protein